MKTIIENYEAHVRERAEQGLPPLALDPEQVGAVIQLLKDGDGDTKELLYLLENRVNPGVDPAAQVKAKFLLAVANGESVNGLDIKQAIFLLGTMLGGYNVDALLELVASEDESIAEQAAEALKKNLFVYDKFDKIESLVRSGNQKIKKILQYWASGQWFKNLDEIPKSIDCIVYKVDGEINTDDFSPASNAWSRADIPLHSQCMGGVLFPDGPKEIAELKEQKNLPVVFVGDVVGTGSSRKSACNSLLWHIGEDIPYVPNKKRGGVVLGGLIAPIFFNTLEDSGGLPIETDVSKLTTGKQITIDLENGKIVDSEGELLSEFKMHPATVPDEFRAGGRVNLVIGKELSEKSAALLEQSADHLKEIFLQPIYPKPKEGQGYTLAQKMVGRACETEGILPGTSCLPRMTTVGSQDTTGPMTASEISELACLKFQAGLVMQSFCHTAAYPKLSDIKTHETLPGFFQTRGGVALYPGDGVIHPWLNRFLIPDTVGTGGDSHTRFPIGISFPAGSGLVAFAASLGFMPLDMPESVLVRFSGKLAPGLTIRDVVNYIPYRAIQEGLLTVEKKNKVNVFSGKILEIQGLEDLTVLEAFEFTDASAERSAAASTFNLSTERVKEYLQGNVEHMEWMVANRYGHTETIQKRLEEVRKSIDGLELLRADENAKYAAILDINLDDLKEPVLACPNDPDDVKLLSEITEGDVDEVFIGSCMTNISHFQAAAKVLDRNEQAKSRLWLCPPTKMDEDQLRREGAMSIFAKAGARMEVPGCSLCMGNQARTQDNAVVVSTSTRNFNNRMGKGARVYLSSAELAAITAALGRLPNPDEYQTFIEESSLWKK